MVNLVRKLGLVLVVAACEAPTAHPVAQVGGWTLSGDRLADLLVLAQPLPLDSATVAAVVDEWVVRAALARYELGGGDLLGQEPVSASLWMEIREATLSAAAASKAQTGPIDDDRAREVFESDSLRLFAHILRRVDAATSPEERALQRRTAQEILNALRSGRTWPEMVTRSEDAATRDQSGLLGLLSVDDLPPALRTVGSLLQPGQVSAVVEGPEGFHVLYRPRYLDVMDSFRELLHERIRTRRDERATLETLATMELEVTDAAIATARDLAETPRIPSVGGDPVLTWSGGELDAGVLARYMASLPAPARLELRASSDDEIAVVLGQLAAREARLQAARKAGVRPDSTRVEELRSLHSEEVRSWREAVPVGGGEVSAREALGRYMERLVSRQAVVDPVPGVLRWWVLSGEEWSVDENAMMEAATRAQELVRSAAGGDGPA